MLGRVLRRVNARGLLSPLSAVSSENMSNFRWKKHLSFILVLSAGLALRLWFVKHAAHVEGDTTMYGNIAANLLRSHVYGYSETDAGVQPTLIRLPGYPLFLMLCFRLFGIANYTAVMLVQTAFDLATCLLLSTLALALFGRRAASAALLASALCPFTANYVAVPLTETLTLFLITLALLSLYRWLVSIRPFGPWLWSLSAALAYAALLRPEQILLAVAVLGTLLWKSVSPGRKAQHRKHQLLPILAAGLCTLLPLAPWTVRNWRTFHVFQPLAPRSATDPGEHIPTGFQHWYRTWAVDFASTEDVYWKYEDSAIDIADLPRRAFDSPAQYSTTAALLRDYNLTTTDSPDLNRRFEDLARDRNHSHPLRSVLLPVARLANMLLRPRTELSPLPADWWKWRDHPRQSALAASYAALNLVWLVPGAVGLYRWGRASRPRTPEATTVLQSMLVFVVLRSLLLLTLDNSEPRYTLEFFPILTLGIASLFARSPAVTNEPTASPE